MNDLDTYFRTGRRLQVALDNADCINGMKDMLDALFYDLIEIDLSGDVVPGVPYWLAESDISYGWSGRTLSLSEDRWDPCASAPMLRDTALHGVDLYYQYVPGRHDPYRLGQILYADNGPYVYIGSECLPEEQELQAVDGTFAYYYRGYAYIRILVLLEDVQGMLEYPSGIL